MGDVIMTDTATAAFVLRAATDAGILLGTDGHVSPPRDMPNDSWSSFGQAMAEHRDEIIELIRREGGK